MCMYDVLLEHKRVAYSLLHFRGKLSEQKRMHKDTNLFSKVCWLCVQNIMNIGLRLTKLQLPKFGMFFSETHCMSVVYVNENY